jgi:hypothetical protein
LRSFFTNFLEPISYLLIAVALLFYLKSKKINRVWVLFIFYSVATILMFFASFKVLPQKNNIREYDLLLLSGTIFISIYFFLLLETKFKKGFAIFILFLGCLNFIKREFIFHQYSAFDSLGFYMFSLFTIILVFMYFNQVLKTISNKSIFLNFDFWISVSLLVYHLGSFVIFLSLYALSVLVYRWEDRLSIGNLWAGQNILLFVSAICINTGVAWIIYHRE